MKIQNMAIIFIIIILPITLLLSSYTKMQIDAIAIQTQYATKLRDATYDGITAFQLNTADNKYSSVSDSMRRDVTAAIQTFISSFAKNIGMSGATETTIKPYIPAIVFTLYDGYYIYAPSFSYLDLDAENEQEVDNDYMGTIGTMDYALDEDGNYKLDKKGNRYLEFKIEEDARTYSTEQVIQSFKKAQDEQSKGKYEHVLKPYIYYTARYVKGDDTDVVINYSLDNYMVVYGKINGEEVTNAGYLELVKKVKYNDGGEKLYRKYPVTTVIFSNEENRSNRINETWKEELKEKKVTSAELLYDRYTNSLDTYTVTTVDKANIYSLYSNAQIKADTKYNTGWYIGVSDNNDNSEDYYVDAYSAAEYYDEAMEFTIWVDKYLGDIKASDARKLDGQEYEKEIIDENGKSKKVKVFSDEKIFDFFTGEGEGEANDEENDPIKNESIFNEHKREIIKISIEDNLEQAIASYNGHSGALGTEYNFKMPILSEVEWDKVLKNVCMMTFVQGLQAGTKIYNDYAIVTSTKNKEYVSPDEIYYINEDESGESTGDGKYHRLGCSHLNDENIKGYKSSDFDKQSYEYEDFEREILEDGKLGRITGDGPVDRTKHYSLHEYEACYYCIVNSTPTGDKEEINEKRQRAYDIAMAREKYNFYKVNTYLRERKADIFNVSRASGYKEKKSYTIINETAGGSMINLDVFLPRDDFNKITNYNKYPLVIIIDDGKTNINWNDYIGNFMYYDYAICKTKDFNASNLKYIVYYMSQKDYVDKNNIFIISADESARITAENVYEYEQIVKAIVLISPDFYSTTVEDSWNNIFKFKKSVLLLKGRDDGRDEVYNYAENRINSITKNPYYTGSYRSISNIKDEIMSADGSKGILSFLNTQRRNSRLAKQKRLIM